MNTTSVNRDQVRDHLHKLTSLLHEANVLLAGIPALRFTNRPQLLKALGLAITSGFDHLATDPEAAHRIATKVETRLTEFGREARTLRFRATGSTFR